ncbi:hypothetical protein PAPHI01_1311 [Pancytospora philotis]|nr:hypothetical protein PAPHI01_1311 [Pancytospora philotis]
MPSTSYENEMLKRLEAFKGAEEWSDFIAMLSAVNAVIEKYNEPRVPHTATLVKRLNQCLSPLLPAGVHMKTLETYALLFTKLPRESLLASFPVITQGLFSFSMHCRIIVTAEYLDLLDKYIVPLAPEIPADNLLVGILPSLETESSEFYDRALLMMMDLRKRYSSEELYAGIWRVFTEYPTLRISISNFFVKGKAVCYPDHRAVVKAVCSGIESDSMYVVRTMLDLVPVGYPLAPASRDDQSEETPSPDAMAELRTYNALLIRNVLRIFLKKEASINKRTFKWLGINGPGGVSNVERGLSTYIGTSEEDLSMLFKILFSLADFKDVLPLVLENIVLGMLISIQAICAEPKKFTKSFGALGLDYLYRVFFLRLAESLGEKDAGVPAEEESLSVESPEGESSQSDSSDDAESVHSASIVEDDGTHPVTHDCGAVLDAIVFGISKLELVDEHAARIHIPLLAVLVVQHRERFSEEQFVRFMDLFLSYAVHQNGEEDKPVLAAEIQEAYKREKLEAFSKLDLVRAVATALSKSSSPEQRGASMTFRPGRMMLREGVIVYEDGDDYEAMGGSPPVGNDASTNNTPLLSINDGPLPSDHDAPMLSDNDPSAEIEEEALEESNNSDEDSSYDTTTLILFQRFIQAFSIKIFAVDTLRQIAAVLVRNYKFKCLIEILGNHMAEEELYQSAWSDFMRTGIPTYLFFYDFSRQIVRDLPHIDRSAVVAFLGAAIPEHKYFPVLFAFSNLVERSDEQLTDLMVGIENPVPFIRFMFETYCTCGVYSNSFRYIEHPNYNKISSILSLFARALDNHSVVDCMANNVPIHIEGFEGSTIKECVCALLTSLIITEDESDRPFPSASMSNASMSNSSYLSEHSYNDNDPVSRLSRLASNASEMLSQSRYSLSIPSPSMRSSENISFNDNTFSMLSSRQSDSSFAPSIQYGGPSRTSQASVHRKVFKILYRLHTKGIQVFLPHQDRVKEFIRRSSSFYILKKSLFLVLDDVDFILEVYLKNYREIFWVISRLEIKVKFFNTLLRRDALLTVDMLLAMFNHLKNTPGYDWNGYYETAMAVIGRTEGRTHTDISAGSEASDSEDEPRQQSASFYSAECLLELMYRNNTKLFVSSFAGASNHERIFALHPLKKELFSKLVRLKDKIQIASGLVQLVQAQDKAIVLLDNMDIFKGRSYSGIEYHKTMLALNLIDAARIYSESAPEAEPGRPVRRGRAHGPPSIRPETYREILENILNTLETRISSGVKLDFNFEHDIEILERLYVLIPPETALVLRCKNCLFALLSSKSFARQAYAIVDPFVRSNIASRPLVDSYIQYFHDNFFEFAVQGKARLLGEIVSSPAFDHEPMVGRLCDGLDASYYFSATSSIVAKTNSLERLGFLVMSTPREFLDNYCARLVAAINTLLGEATPIRAAAYRLCSALILKTDHHSIAHLYPIILEDFLRAVDARKAPNERVAAEMVRCVDLCIWMDSEVFDFATLLLVGKGVLPGCLGAASDMCWGSEDDHGSGEWADMETAERCERYRSMIESSGGYRNLLDLAPDMLCAYFSNVRDYYGFIRSSFYKRDTEAVERNLIALFETK